MKIIRDIKKKKQIKKTIKSLKEQAISNDHWEGFANKKEAFKCFEEYCHELYSINDIVDFLDIKVEFVTVFSNQTKTISLSPRMLIVINFSCCKKVKIISNFLEENPIKYSIFNGFELKAKGEGELRECVREIKSFYKNSNE